MRIFIFYTLVMASLLPISGMANDKLSIIIGLDPILHADRTNDFNERANLVGIKYNKISIMRFTNSYNIESHLVSKDVFKYRHIDNQKLYSTSSIAVGIVHGYGDTKVNTFGGLLPWVIMENVTGVNINKSFSVGVKVSLVPAFDSSVFAKGIVLSYKF